MAIELNVINNDKPKEECGVVGVYTPKSPVAARRSYWALSALQHRGQEAAGIASWIDNQIRVHKDTGLVASVFRESHLQELASELSIGHVRYSTTGINQIENASPMVAHGRRSVAVSHNGNLVDAAHWYQKMKEAGHDFVSSSDSEVVAAYLATQGDSPWQAMQMFLQNVRGAFSLCVIAEGKLFACRDPHGIRPLVIGMLTGDGEHGCCVVASETCALDLLGARYVRDVVPGEIVEINESGLHTHQVVAPEPRGCSFEAIYFSRPDSRLGQETVYNIRLRLGKELAKDYPVAADLVVGVPDSGIPMAQGYADETNMHTSQAIVKNRYIARTFIEPTHEERVMSVRKKLNPIAQSIAGQRLVVVDDSLIRGTTLKVLVGLLRDAGAAEVHIRIGSPPARFPCFYGVDMGRPGEYIAENRSVDEISDIIGADSLHYLSIEGLSRALRRPLNQRCTACFTGDYPIAPDNLAATAKDQFQRNAIGG